MTKESIALATLDEADRELFEEGAAVCQFAGCVAALPESEAA
ncbi:hypothetical protein [Microvirgula aerodenitrificans]|nr:hypothetical protein [Microvirgula aerodenitrificans]